MFIFQLVQYIDLQVKAETELVPTVGGGMVTSGPIVV